MSLLAAVCLTPAFSQNLMLEVFSGVNITAYDTPNNFSFNDKNASYFPIGFRIAGGLPNVQIGGEYHTDLTNATFSKSDAFLSTETVIENSYYGGFIRANISPNPAYAFGIILKAGVGIYDASMKYRILDDPSAPQPEIDFDFDGQLGFNGGLGFSLPIAEKLHLEAGYVFNYVKREGGNKFPGFIDYNAFHHSFQLGFSYNFLFGESAKRYDSNKRWKNGWRSSAGGRYKKWGN